MADMTLEMALQWADRNGANGWRARGADPEANSDAAALDILAAEVRRLGDVELTMRALCGALEVREIDLLLQRGPQAAIFVGERIAQAARLGAHLLPSLPTPPQEE